MTKPIPHFLTAIFLICILTSCLTDNEPETYFFDGDIRTLLIQENEVLSGWRLHRLSSEPSDKEVISNWGVVYVSRPTLNHITTVINHSIGAFNRHDVAVERFEFSYEDYFFPAVEVPQKYRYQSPLADEFEIICTWIINDLDGSLIGYKCLYSARYGNVISELTVYIERENGVKTEKANLLSWAEVEGLLKLIDEKFAKAGFEEQE